MFDRAVLGTRAPPRYELEPRRIRDVHDLNVLRFEAARGAVQAPDQGLRLIVNFDALRQPFRAPIFPNRGAAQRERVKARRVFTGFYDDGCFSARDLSP